jgi:small subunit ribosomal protein S21
MIEVTVNGGSLEQAIRELKKKVSHDGIHTEVKRRLTYVKPSERRKAKEIRAAVRRHRMEKRIQRAMERQGNGREGRFAHGYWLDLRREG